MFKLSYSMTDRMNFEQMIKNYLYTIRFVGTPQDVFDYHFPDIEEIVDDIEEAEARILVVAKNVIVENFSSELEEINGAVKVYDGCKLFGTFKNGIEAAEAVRNSDTSWWKLQEAPSYEVL